MKNFLNWMTSTKLGWMIISFMWFATFMMVHNGQSSNWALYVAIPGIVYIVIMVLVMMAYAFVINPIREYRKNKGK